MARLAFGLVVSLLFSACSAIAAVPHADPGVAPVKTQSGTATLAQVESGGIDFERKLPGPSNNQLTPGPGPGPGPRNLPPPGPPPSGGPSIGPPSAQSIGRSVQIPVTLEQMPGNTQRAWLGVNFEAVDEPLSKTLGLIRNGGALVTSTDGPAAKAGVRFGDIVLAFNGQQIFNHLELPKLVSVLPPGAQASLDIWRAAPEGSDFMQTLRRLADGGNSYMMVRLGNMYARGVGVNQSDSEAVQWFRKAANAGNTSAMVSLAYMIGEQRGAPKDPAEIYRLLKTAADAGDAVAANNLGELYKDGKILGKNEGEAAKWLKISAQAGYSPAMVELGLLYQYAETIPKSAIEALTWYKKAAEAGNPSGQTALAIMYHFGGDIPRDDQSALFWYKKGVEGGHPVAMNNLASMLDKGTGTAADPDQAATLMMQALDQRNQFSYDQMTQRKNWRGWSKQFRMALQQRLISAGFYSGRVDGEFGTTTVNAITNYCNRQR